MALISEAKRRANRRNAERSSGPRSEEGKAAVRFNALRHGMAAKTPVLPDEDGEGFAALLADFEARLAPQDESEREAVRELAESTWRKRRGFRLETVVLRALIAREEAGDLTVDDVLKAPALLLRIARYESHLARAYDRALQRLHLLRSLRRPSAPQRVEPAAAAEAVAARNGEGESRPAGAGPSGERAATPAAQAAPPQPRPDPRPNPLPPAGAGTSQPENLRNSAEFGFVLSNAPPIRKRAA